MAYNTIKTDKHLDLVHAEQVCDIAIAHYVMVNHDYDYYIRKKESYLQKTNKTWRYSLWKKK